MLFKISFTLMFMILVSSLGFSKDSNNVAVVKMLRGDVVKKNSEGEFKLKKDDWVSEGDLILTEKASFVRLVFIDKSQINIGPKSEMIIEKFSQKDPGLLNIVKGKIRAKVTKDYLEMNKGNKSKLFMKSNSAVMGIRGTDFLFSYSPETQATSAVLFEGSVAFSKVSFDERVDYKDLDKIVERDHISIKPGEFSVASPKAHSALIPAVLNTDQKVTLEKNDTFKEFEVVVEEKKKVGSLVPKGLNGQIVASTDGDLKKHVNAIVQVKDRIDNRDSSGKNALGFVSAAGDIKPTNGAFLHLGTGSVIAPGSDSAYDPHSNSFKATGSTGSVGADGEYIPPKGLALNNRGEFVEKASGRLPASNSQFKKDIPNMINAGDGSGPKFIGPCPPEFCPNGPLMDRLDKPEFNLLNLERSKVKFQFNNN